MVENVMNGESIRERAVKDATVTSSVLPSLTLNLPRFDALNGSYDATDDIFAESLAALAGSLGTHDVSVLRAAQLNARGAHGY